MDRSISYLVFLGAMAAALYFAYRTFSSLGAQQYISAQNTLLQAQTAWTLPAGQGGDPNPVQLEPTALIGD